MEYSDIIGSKLRVAKICLGAGHFGPGMEESETFQLLDSYVDLGGNFIDTAKVYCDWLPGERSSSEKRIGRWLAKCNKRSQLVIATKGGHPELNRMTVSRLSQEEIVSDLNQSLRNLQVDEIDFYWLHRDDPARDVGEIAEILNTQARLGKIRYFGVSNWQVDRIRAFQEYAQGHQLQELTGNQMLWNIGVVDPTAIDPTLVCMSDEMEKYHELTGLAAIPYSSQANGIFQKLAANEGEDSTSRLPRMYPSLLNQKRYNKIKQLSARSGYTISQIVLGYLTSHTFPVIPIIGPRNIEQLMDSVNSVWVKLSQDQMMDLIN